MCDTPQIKLPMKSSLQHTLIHVYTRALNLNQMLLRGNRSCKADKKKFARVPAGSYKLIMLVQARQTGGANDEIFSPQAQITAV